MKGDARFIKLLHHQARIPVHKGLVRDVLMGLPRYHGLSFPVSSLCTLTPCVACRRGCPWLYNAAAGADGFLGMAHGPQTCGLSHNVGLEENVLPGARAVCDIRATYVGIMRKACAWAGQTSHQPAARRRPLTAKRRRAQEQGTTRTRNPCTAATCLSYRPPCGVSVDLGGHQDMLPKERGEVTLDRGEVTGCPCSTRSPYRTT